MRKRKKLIGQIFGKLVVLSFDGMRRTKNSKRQYSFWLCKCTCGNQVSARGGSLTTGRVTNCGCFYRNTIKGEASFNRYYKQYQNNAKKNNRTWALTKKQFKKLTQGNCYYCGTKPNHQYNPIKTPRGSYVCNGIDRVDNNKGYILSNCVSCCKMCNCAKRDYTLEKFIGWLKVVCEHLKKENFRMGKTENSIKRLRGQYYFLSNFHYCCLIYNGKIWKSLEHLFQAMKTEDKYEREIIRMMSSSAAAKTRGRKVKLRKDWDKRKKALMLLLVRLKFKQNDKLRRKLLDTDFAYLVEGNNWHDNYWGDCFCSKCKNIKGQNHLGVILMKIRKELRDENI